MTLFRLVARIALAYALVGGADAASTPLGPLGPFDPNAIETYEITVEPDVLSWLRINARKESYVPASLRFRGQEWSKIAMRFKGAFGSLISCFDERGRQICPKLSIKLRFDKFDARGRFFGLRRLNFHSMVKDQTHMHDHIGYALFREAGIPAPRTAYARVEINGAYEGLFLLVEAVDESFVEAHLSEGQAGSLYKEVWPGCRDRRHYRRALRTRELEGGVSKLIALGQSLRNAPDAEFESVVAGAFDLPTLLRYLVVDQAIGNWDGIRGWWCHGLGCDAHRGCLNHNVYIYQESSGDRFHLVPWDLDKVLSVHKRALWSGAEGPCGPFLVLQNRRRARVNRCDAFLTRAGKLLWEDYRVVAREMLDGPLHPSVLEARVDRLAAFIEQEVRDDPNGPGLQRWREEVQRLPEHIRGLHAIASEMLERAPRASEAAN